MQRRIPVSLKFDDEETAFYKFIEEKKNDRDLSPLIVDLLHLFFQSDVVKSELSAYLDSKNPYLKAKEEMERIAIQHSKNTVVTNMVHDYRSKEKVVREQPAQKSEPVDMTLLLEQLSVMVEKAVDSAVSTRLPEVSSAGSKKDVISAGLNIDALANDIDAIMTETTKSRPRPPKKEEPAKETKKEVSRPASFNKLMKSM